MANRNNHYEAAFEAFLRERLIPYVAVDEKKRSLWGDESLKSLDFIVSTPSGPSWLVDVKGRRFPSGRRRQYWKNWSTSDDVRSLLQWEDLFGERFGGLLVFAYNIAGDRAPLPERQLFEFRDSMYGFVAIRLRDYAEHARLISPKWDTVAVSGKQFRDLAEPIQRFL